MLTHRKYINWQNPKPTTQIWSFTWKIYAVKSPSEWICINPFKNSTEISMEPGSSLCVITTFIFRDLVNILTNKSSECYIGTLIDTETAHFSSEVTVSSLWYFSELSFYVVITVTLTFFPSQSCALPQDYFQMVSYVSDQSRRKRMGRGVCVSFPITKESILFSISGSGCNFKLHWIFI